MGRTTRSSGNSSCGSMFKIDETKQSKPLKRKLVSPTDPNSKSKHVASKKRNVEVPVSSPNPKRRGRSAGLDPSSSRSSNSTAISPKTSRSSKSSCLKIPSAKKIQTVDDNEVVIIRDLIQLVFNLINFYFSHFNL